MDSWTEICAKFNDIENDFNNRCEFATLVYFICLVRDNNPDNGDVKDMLEAAYALWKKESARRAEA